MKKRKFKIKWYKMCSFCKSKIKMKDEHGYPLYYINEKPLEPWEWDHIEEITVFCDAVCSLGHHEKKKERNM